MGEHPEKKSNQKRETFAGRGSFIFAAIGSAVGLGNIWRFPYVAYANGGGAFIVPYLVALLTAGIPLLFLFFAIGHRFRGSPPLAFRRLHPATEVFGWWQVLVTLVISLYYAVVVAWAGAYVVYSFTLAWGDDPAGFFQHGFLHTSDAVTVGFDFVPSVLIPLVLVWVASILLLACGVQKGIARLARIFMPLLFVMFVFLVVRALMLPGAEVGLNSLFTPDWSKLADSSIWIAAYAQIFFSLSVGFGIMLTYASYLKARTNLTSSALVVGFANSSFELLAGIGVFAALGFIATRTGQDVSEVADSGVGLAFISFPTILSRAPLGNLLGVLFFLSLVFAGFTSLISVLEVIISSVHDKLGFGRVPTTLAVGVPCAIVSTVVFATSTGLNLLDVTDAFITSFGIVAVALIAVLVLSIGLSALPVLRNHLNTVSSFKVGRKWQFLAGGVTPVILGFTLINSLEDRITNGYGDMPAWFVNTFGWGMILAVIAIAFLLSRMPWAKRSRLYNHDPDDVPVAAPILDPDLEADRVAGEFAGEQPPGGAAADEVGPGYNQRRNP